MIAKIYHDKPILLYSYFQGRQVWNAKKDLFPMKKMHLQASESVVTNQAHHYFNFNFLIISGIN